jgi:hypothetical protein
MGLALAALAASGLLAAAGGEPGIIRLVGAGILACLALERLVAGVRAAVGFQDPAGLLFVPMHLMRDVAWVAAIVVWSLRRMRGLGSRPAHSMHPRPASSGVSNRRAP